MTGVRLPADLTGWTVADLGGYDGRYAKLCLERGAESAVVVDNKEWRRYGWSGPNGGRMPAGVGFVLADLHDHREPADLVICSNVIYHLVDPFACLAHLRKLTRRLLLLRTSFVPGEAEVEGPAGWTWYPSGSGHPNGTVWCRPTPGGLRASLRKAGFTGIVEQGREGDSVAYECA